MELRWEMFANEITQAHLNHGSLILTVSQVHLLGNIQGNYEFRWLQ